MSSSTLSDNKTKGRERILRRTSPGAGDCAWKNLGVSSVGRSRSEVDAECWVDPEGGCVGVDSTLDAGPRRLDGATFILASSLARLDCSGVIMLPSFSPFTPVHSAPPIKQEYPSSSMTARYQGTNTKESSMCHRSTRRPAERRLNLLYKRGLNKNSRSIRSTSGPTSVSG